MKPSLLFVVLDFAVGSGAAVALVRQCRRPAWLPGRLFARMMNASHHDLMTWGLDHLQLANAGAILDVGCGGGAAIRELARRAPRAKVSGIDYSAASLAVARRTNASLIERGRVELRHASVSHLPFDADAFDVVTAFETHYYWPDLASDLREIHRVLRPDGRLAIVAEAYRRPRGGADAFAMKMIGGKLLSADQHRDALLAAGFGDVQVFEEERKGWLCVVGAKAAGAASRNEAPARS